MSQSFKFLKSVLAVPRPSGSGLRWPLPNGRGTDGDIGEEGKEFA